MRPPRWSQTATERGIPKQPALALRIIALCVRRIAEAGPRLLELEVSPPETQPETQPAARSVTQPPTHCRVGETIPKLGPESPHGASPLFRVR